MTNILEEITKQESYYRRGLLTYTEMLDNIIRIADEEKPRRIEYTFKEGNIVCHYTSDDYVSPEIMNKIRYAWIESIKLIDDVWNVTLYTD